MSVKKLRKALASSSGRSEAMQVSAVRRVLRSACDVNERWSGTERTVDARGKSLTLELEHATVLMLAAMGGHLSVLELLLAKNRCSSTMNAEDAAGWTAFHFACFCGRVDCAQRLAQGLHSLGCPCGNHSHSPTSESAAVLNRRLETKGLTGQQLAFRAGHTPVVAMLEKLLTQNKFLADVLHKVRENDPTMTTLSWADDNALETVTVGCCDDAFFVLADALPGNTHLHRIDLGEEAHITSRSLSRLAAVLDQCNVVMVNIDCELSEHLDTEKMEAVYWACTHNTVRQLRVNDPALTKLDWTGQNFNDQMLTTMAAALPGNTNLQSVILSYIDGLTDAGFKMLAQTLGQSNVHIVELDDCYEISCSIDAAIRLQCHTNEMRLVASNDPAVTSIHWTINHWGRRASYWIGFAEEDAGLRTVDGVPCTGGQSVEELERALQNNSYVTELHLTRLPFSGRHFIAGEHFRCPWCTKTIEITATVESLRCKHCRQIIDAEGRMYKFDETQLTLLKDSLKSSQVVHAVFKEGRLGRQSDRDLTASGRKIQDVAVQQATDNAIRLQATEALHKAVNAGQAEVVKRLLCSGFDVRQTTTAQRSLLQTAVAAEHANTPNVVNALVRAGADMEYTYDFTPSDYAKHGAYNAEQASRTAFLRACYLCRVKTAEVLVHAGCNIDAKDNENKTAEMLATESYKSEEQKKEMLDWLKAARAKKVEQRRAQIVRNVQQAQLAAELAIYRFPDLDITLASASLPACLPQSSVVTGQEESSTAEDVLEKPNGVDCKDVAVETVETVPVPMSPPACPPPQSPVLTAPETASALFQTAEPPPKLQKGEPELDAAPGSEPESEPESELGLEPDEAESKPELRRSESELVEEWAPPFGVDDAACGSGKLEEIAKRLGLSALQLSQLQIIEFNIVGCAMATDEDWVCLEAAFEPHEAAGLRRECRLALMCAAQHHELQPGLETMQHPEAASREPAARVPAVKAAPWRHVKMETWDVLLVLSWARSALSELSVDAKAAVGNALAADETEGYELERMRPKRLWKLLARVGVEDRASREAWAEVTFRRRDITLAEQS
jgi:ankyrin repeat protein